MNSPLLEHQKRHFDILKVHSQQGGFCLILGEPGTGKTVLKQHLLNHNPRDWINPVINRSLYSWHNILRLLCQAFDLETNGNDHKCEARLINAARQLNQNRLFWKLIRFQSPSSTTATSSPLKPYANSDSS